MPVFLSVGKTNSGSLRLRRSATHETD